MGIEVEAEYGGTDSSFFMSCLVVEELAKVDPAVSVMCDVQNTLIVTLFRKYGTPQQKEQYLPRLAENMVNNVLLTIQRNYAVISGKCCQLRLCSRDLYRGYLDVLSLSLVVNSRGRCFE